MEMEDAELGRLARDHLCAHEQVARQKAELERVGEDLMLLGDNLKRRPQSIRVEEAKVTLKDDRGEDRTVPWSALNVADIFRTVNGLRGAMERERQLAGRMRGAGMGYMVDGPESRSPPGPDMLGPSG